MKIKAGGEIDEVLVKKLDFGDYGCEIAGNRLPIYFERKSIGDLFGTLTSGIDRFKREVTRAKEANCTLYLAIEGSLLDVYKGSEFSIVAGSQIVRTIFMYKVKYGLEPVFCNDREQMKYYILETFDACRRNLEREVRSLKTVGEEKKEGPVNIC